MKKSDEDVEALVLLFKRLEGKKLKRVKMGNPQKLGTPARARWNLLFKRAKQGTSVAEYITAKGNPKTLRNAIGRGYIVVE